jgi:hypothetical protein
MRLPQPHGFMQLPKSLKVGEFSRGPELYPAFFLRHEVISANLHNFQRGRVNLPVLG